MAAVVAISLFHVSLGLAVLVFVIGQIAVLGVRIITRNGRPRVRYLVALSALLALTTTHVVMSFIASGATEMAATEAVIAAKEAAYRQLRIDLGILLFAASLIPGYLWCIRPPLEADASQTTGSTSHRPVVTYFALAPILLPLGWLAAFVI